MTYKGKPKREGKKTRPLDKVALRDLALSYAARFATTGAKVEAYLARKIRERGIAEDADGRTMELDVTGIVTQLIDLGYVNDEAYARMKTRDLTSRGYGARRVEQALWAAGVEEGVRADNTPGEADSRRAATLMAKKRRFGPFAQESHRDAASDSADPQQARLNAQKVREKQVAAMVRAGHGFDHVRFIMDAASIDMVEEWIEEAQADERDDINQGEYGEDNGLW